MVTFGGWMVVDGALDSVRYYRNGSLNAYA
jgi:hypothetical protein